MEYSMKILWVSLLIISVAYFSACSDAEPGKSVSNQSNNGKTNSISNTVNSNRTNNKTSPEAQTLVRTTHMTNNQTHTTPVSTTPPVRECKEILPALGPCDPLCQTGCGAAEHCYTQRPTASDPVVSKCGIRGVKGQDMMCDKNADCGVGFGCRNFRGEVACRQYCDPSGKHKPTCAEDFACIPIGGEARVGVCVKINHQCEVLNATCTAGEACYDFQAGRRCAKAGDKKVDEVCTSSAACEVGLRCVSIQNATTCRKLCDPKAGMSGCDKGTSCHVLNAQSGDPIAWGACF